MPMIDRIKALSSHLLPEIIEIRRALHARPELSFQEFGTSAFIQEKLTSWGIPFQTGYGGTGISAWIEGQDPNGRRIALRADMDALPIQELNEVPYRSTQPGVMHACGHDVHTACLLGAVKILSELRAEISGSVQFIFQPGEEKLPGGASLMIQDGIFSPIRPAALTPELPVGKVGFRSGPFMASADEIYVTVKGKGGHGARPDANVDPVLISSHLIIALQQVVSRWSDPQMPTVLSFGKVIADGATNVIPGEVKLEGTFRTFNENWRFEAHRRVIALAEGLVRGMGGEIDFRIETGYPVLANDETITAQARALAISYLGNEHVVDLPMRTTAEDFAHYTREIPGCFYRLGTSGADGTHRHSVHNPMFDIDEKAMATGMGLMAWIALNT